MNLDYIRTLYDYNCWARDRLLTAAQGMTDEEYGRPNGFNYDGICTVLAHALDAEYVWFSRFRGETFTRIAKEDVATLDSFTERWRLEEARAREFLATLTEADLERDIVLRRSSGQEVHTPLWQLLVHVVNHGTQHRSEAAEALTMVGRSPGSLDFTTMLWGN